MHNDSGGFADDSFTIKLKTKRKTASGKKEVSKTLSFLKTVDRIARSSAKSASASARSGSSKRGKSAGKNSYVKAPAKSAQRAVVKARYVRKTSTAARKAAIKSHISYITRSGAGQEPDSKPIAYNNGQEMTGEQLQEWASKAATDKHHFRFIVSPENSHNLDMREFAEELVKRMEQDLNTRLDCIVVNHYNTDTPHTHLMVRGVDDQGRDLVISRDYIANGVRGRASEIATERLGYRSELEIREGMTKDVSKDRFTQIDKDLLKMAAVSEDMEIDLRNNPVNFRHSFAVFKRSVQMQRLKHLEEIELAKEVSPGVWTIADNMETTLRNLGTRGDIIKTMHKSLKEAGQERVIFDPKSTRAPITGVVVDKGLSDELHERKYLLISATDNRAYYVPLTKYSEEPGHEAAPGSIVTVAPHAPAMELKKSDRNIMEIAAGNNGLYTPEKHLEQVNGYRLPQGATKERFVDSHLTRLHVLESQGLVERTGKSSWRVPPDLEEKIKELSERTAASAQHVKITLESRQNLTQQIEAEAPTWLDRQLPSGVSETSGRNSVFRESFEAAKRERAEKLCQLQLAEKTPQGVELKAGFLDELYKRQMVSANKALSRQYGTPVDLQTGDTFTGTVEGTYHLPSGPHVVLREGQQFTCVPFRKGMEEGSRIVVQMQKGALHERQVSFKSVGKEQGRGR